MNKPIHEKICDLRKAHAMTQEKLGAALGVSSQAVSKWEKGESLPDIMSIPRLCEVLGISADALLEIPTDRKRDACMKNLAEYAKAAGDCCAAYEAICACSSVPEAKDGSVHIQSNGMLVQNVTGIATVISGKQAMDKVKQVGQRDLRRACEFLANENYMLVFQHLDFDEARDEEEIAALCQLSSEQVREALFALMKLGMCEAIANGKFRYGVHSYIGLSLLIGVFLGSEEGYRGIRSISISSSDHE